MSKNVLFLPYKLSVINFVKFIVTVQSVRGVHIKQ